MNFNYSGFNESFIKILTLLIILGITFVSCRDSATSSSSETDKRENLEKVLAEKLGPNMTIEDLGTTMEEFEATYYSAQKKGVSNLSTLSESSAPPVWESNYGTGLQLSDDDCQLIQLDFPFTFYGKSYNELWVNSNGNITFDGCNTNFWPTEIPDGSNLIVAPIYGDFNFNTPDTTNSDVFINTVGTAPDRTFVVTWLNVHPFSAISTNINTFQLQLSEETGSILLAYNGLSTDGFNIVNGDPYNVGVSSGAQYINSASGDEIPSLDMTNICYKPEEGGYQEIFGSCNAPVAVAGPDQTVECEGETTSISLDGSASTDPAGNTLTYSWSLNGSEIATGATPTVPLGMGNHNIALTVTNSEGKTGSDEVTINVVDTTPPELDYTVNDKTLWPANNKMRLAVSGIAASDICDSDPSLSVIVVTNSESTKGNGKDATASDWDIVERTDGTVDVYLRAEKERNSDRVYTVTITSEDSSGNRIVKDIEITVPHNQGT